MKNTRFIFFAAFLFLFFPSVIFASTFPVEDAGISAYVKLDGSGVDILNKIHWTLLESEKRGEGTHVIGKTEVEMMIESLDGEDKEYLFSLYPYIYADLEGWLVAYFPKDKPASKIVQWNNYSPKNLKPSVLEEAIDQVIEEVNKGEEFYLSYSDNPKHYHFQHQEANRLTVIINTVDNTKREPGDGKIMNNFSVTVPGEIKESSYSVYYSRIIGGSDACSFLLSADGEEVYRAISSTRCRENVNNREFIYRTYDEEGFSFVPWHQHSVVFKGAAGRESLEMRLGAATVLIYKVD